MGKIKNDILHVKGIDVGIYTEDTHKIYHRIPWYMGNDTQPSFQSGRI